MALDADEANPASTLLFSATGYVPGTAPFNHSNWPSFIGATVREVPSWGVDRNSAAEPPASPACTNNTNLDIQCAVTQCRSPDGTCPAGTQGVACSGLCS